MSGYLRNFVDAKTMSFLVKDKNLLVKCKRIWTKVKSIMESKKFMTGVLRKLFKNQDKIL